MALQGVRQPRPMTHDLIGNLLGALDDVSLLRVIITKREFPPELARQLADGEAVLLGGTETFYAELQHRDRVITVTADRPMAPPWPSGSACRSSRRTSWSRSSPQSETTASAPLLPNRRRCAAAHRMTAFGARSRPSWAHRSLLG
jgi:hypothetical protein